MQCSSHSLRIEPMSDAKFLSLSIIHCLAHNNVGTKTNLPTNILLDNPQFNLVQLYLYSTSQTISFSWGYTAALSHPSSSLCVGRVEMLLLSRFNLALSSTVVFILCDFSKYSILIADHCHPRYFPTAFLPGRWWFPAIPLVINNVLNISLPILSISDVFSDWCQ